MAWSFQRVKGPEPKMRGTGKYLCRCRKGVLQRNLRAEEEARASVLMSRSALQAAAVTLRLSQGWRMYQGMKTHTAAAAITSQGVSRKKENMGR